jgi:hypothetical protein
MGDFSSTVREYSEFTWFVKWSLIWERSHVCYATVILRLCKQLLRVTMSGGSSCCIACILYANSLNVFTALPQPPACCAGSLSDFCRLHYLSMSSALRRISVTALDRRTHFTNTNITNVANARYPNRWLLSLCAVLNDSVVREGHALLYTELHVSCCLPCALRASEWP